jgi:ABC-2 type transport system permease protein
MNDLFLILKYGFKNKARPKKKGLLSNNSVFGNIFGYLFPAILFMFIMLPFMLNIFNSTMIEIMPGVTFAELMASMYIALMSLLFFLQYSPAIINTLFNNDNIEFLLTTPVKKGTIFLSSAIDSFLVSGLPIGMMLSVIIAYGIAADINIFNSWIDILLFHRKNSCKKIFAINVFCKYFCFCVYDKLHSN